MNSNPEPSYTRGDAPGYVFNPTSGYVSVGLGNKTQPNSRSHRYHSESSNYLPPGVPDGSSPSFSNVTTPQSHTSRGIHNDLLQMQRRRNSLSQASRQVVPMPNEIHRHRGSITAETHRSNRPLQNNNTPASNRSVAIVEPSRQNSPNETDGLTLDNISVPPPEELKGKSVEHPPDCGSVGWRIVTACCILNACSTVVMLTLDISLPGMKKQIGETAEDIDEAFRSVRMMAAPVTVLLIIYSGYRRLCMVGGAFIGFGFFISGFVSHSLPGLIGFLISGLAAIGMSFWHVTVIVVLLEYFESGRLLALILSHVGTVIGTFVMLGINDSENEDFIWETAFKWQLAIAAIGVGVSLMLHSLPLTCKEDDNKTSFISNVVSALDPNLFKNGVLYFILILIFLDQLAKPIPMQCIPTIMTNTTFSNDEIRLYPFMEPSGTFIGMLLTLFFRRKKGMAPVLCVWGLSNIFITYLTFQIPDLIKFPWLISYPVMLGINKVVIFLLFHYAVPDTFGRLNIRVVEGIVIFIAGLGRSASTPVLGNLVGNAGTHFTAAFYFSAAILLLTGLLALVLRIIINRQNNKENAKRFNNSKNVQLRKKDTNKQETRGDNSNSSSRTTPKSVRQPTYRPVERVESDIVEIEIREIRGNSTTSHI